MRITTFASGSSGNCTLVSMGDSHFLIDAGLSARRIHEHLTLSGIREEQLSAILITHEHSDHIRGLTTWVKRRTVPIFASRIVANRLCGAVPGIERCLVEVPAGQDFPCGSVQLRAFHTPHDTPESVGWRIDGGPGGVFALATDMGYVTDEIRDGLLGAWVALIEANHDVELLRTGPYPVPLKKRILSDHGHLSNDDCAELAALLARNGTRHIILGHLSEENNTPALAFRTVKTALEASADTADTRLFVATAAKRLMLDFEGYTALEPV